QQDDYDRQQRSKLGVMVSIMGAGIFLMILIPNPLWGKLVYLCSATVICGLGLLLVRSARHDQKTI
ncbi:transporter, partial [Porticoccaceae bacterium]|nr:transporter [Porticoccaceae bacterium]